MTDPDDPLKFEPADDEIVVVPAQTVSTEYIRRVASFVEEVARLRIEISGLADRMAAEILTRRFEATWLGSSEAAAEAFDVATGWDRLATDATAAASLLLAATGDLDTDLPNEDAPTWFLRLKLRHVLNERRRYSPDEDRWTDSVPDCQEELERRGVDTS
ncbi:hypothetical protein HC251_14055 [Iamia sp. SCSIO 61187]|uniref:hypothetical protein n=1 Tax=Iamia sp. SCSIO 61187 TaxID=2722752 RepID=UPI001C63830D|nr:hypothetical protein [Iamia sp. SCSIO 61187]QYG93435.1 hypothetical protein HC251_14055 [Iamia sp. SCSIO 61187]